MSRRLLRSNTWLGVNNAFITDTLPSAHASRERSHQRHDGNTIPEWPWRFTTACSAEQQLAGQPQLPGTHRWACSDSDKQNLSGTSVLWAKSYSSQQHAY